MNFYSCRYPGKLVFCLNDQCLPQAVKEDSKKKRDLRIDYPPFDGIIGISSFVRQKNVRLPDISGFTFVDT